MLSTYISKFDVNQLYGWGYNGNGELGIGTNNNQHSPVRVSNLGKVFITQVLIILLCEFSFK